jgi:hypothetical protein
MRTGIVIVTGAALVAAGLATGFVAIWFGPPVLDCGGLEVEVCERVMEQAAQDPYDQAGGDVADEGTGPGQASGPVVSFRFEPRPGYTDCGDWTIEKYRWGIGPFAAIKGTWSSSPRALC